MALPKPVFDIPTTVPERSVAQAASPVFLRKLTSRDVELYKEHLLRLTPADRCNRFMGAICDDRVAAYCRGLDLSNSVILGAFIDGELRGVGELAMGARLPRAVAEIALSVESAWQDLGIGTLLLKQVLTMARNRYVSRVYMMCLVGNRKMQKIARKFEANLIFEDGGVEGSLSPNWPSYLTLMEEAKTDGRGFFHAFIGQAKPTRH